MKKVIFLLVLFPYIAVGQIVQNFESADLNDWVESPAGRWKAEEELSVSGAFSLHHSFDNQDAGSDRIGIPVSSLKPSMGLTTWSFLVRHGYDPSSSNNWAVFLMSDSEPAAMSDFSGVSGYAVGVNLTGYDDTLKIWKIKDGIITAIVNTGLNWQTAIGISSAVRLNIERTVDGEWSLAVLSTDGSVLSESHGNDSELFNTQWFVISYKYSSTRDRLFWFDDLTINGLFQEDKIAPEIVQCEASGGNTVRIVFDEKPDEQSIATENFILNASDNHTISVLKINDLTYILEFEFPLINKMLNTLELKRTCDDYGNCTQNISVQFTLIRPDPGDVVISEIMADPLPEVSLPGKEYFEITNRTDFVFNLEGWRLISDDQFIVFPGKTLYPHDILIVCATKDTSFFTKYGKVVGLKTFPLLTDGGKIICLSDSSGKLIHGVEYSSDWYSDELKSRGGWSLEMIDIDYPFYYEGNWRASQSRSGGTPGEINSVSRKNPDYQFYGLLNVFPDDSNTVIVRFSEPVFNIENNLNNITINGNMIESIFPTDPLLREFIVKPASPLGQKEVYELSVSGSISDFSGNRPQIEKYIFGLPQAAGSGDVLFNELLFNPFPGDPDFIELYNRSEKIIDISRLQVISVNISTGDTSQFYPLSNQKRCLLPNKYYSVTTDREKLIQRYYSSDPANLFETGSLVSMSDKEGHLVLYNMELEKIDEVVYNDDMHYPLLAGTEGVSLEKTGPDNSSIDPVNWHSASESCGWGTPGAENSIYSEVPASNDEVSFSSTRISPDSDGFEDLLTMSLRMNGIGNVVSINIFDERGSYVRNLATNMFIGSEASLIWDGTADDGSPVRTGIYIVLITSFDETGKTNRWKRVCVVVRQ